MRRVKGTIEARASAPPSARSSSSTSTRTVSSWARATPISAPCRSSSATCAPTDGGRTWNVVSRLGDADLHKIVFKHDRLYAWDAVLSALIVSEDGGRSFAEHFTPRGLIIDFEVDPERPRAHRGRHRRSALPLRGRGRELAPDPAGRGRAAGLAGGDRLYAATRDGRVQVSSDGGDSFEDVGRVDGEPYVFQTVSGDELYMALSDGTILHTEDGGPLLGGGVPAVRRRALGGAVVPLPAAPRWSRLRPERTRSCARRERWCPTCRPTPPRSTRSIVRPSGEPHRVPRPQPSTAAWTRAPARPAS